MASRRFLSASALLAAAALFVGCAASPTSEPTDSAEEPIVLRVAAVTSPMTDIVEAAGEAIEAPYEIELVEVK